MLILLYQLQLQFISHKNELHQNTIYYYETLFNKHKHWFI